MVNSFFNHWHLSMDNVFAALASTARRKIIACLHAGELTVGDIGTRFDFSKPALSSHLRVLDEAGLITREKRGQFVFVRLVPERLANTVLAWTAEVCPVAGPLKREGHARKRATPSA